MNKFFIFLSTLPIALTIGNSHSSQHHFGTTPEATENSALNSAFVAATENSESTGNSISTGNSFIPGKTSENVVIFQSEDEVATPTNDTPNTIHVMNDPKPEPNFMDDYAAPPVNGNQETDPEDFAFGIAKNAPISGHICIEGAIQSELLRLHSNNPFKNQKAPTLGNLMRIPSFGETCLAIHRGMSLGSLSLPESFSYGQESRYDNQEDYSCNNHAKFTEKERHYAINLYFETRDFEETAKAFYLYFNKPCKPNTLHYWVNQFRNRNYYTAQQMDTAIAYYILTNNLTITMIALSEHYKKLFKPKTILAWFKQFSECPSATLYPDQNILKSIEKPKLEKKPVEKPVEANGTLSENNLLHPTATSVTITSSSE